jgi:hypothetical protein
MIRCSVTLALVLAISHLAHADEAADHLAKATSAYNIQDWAAALAEYREAYRIDPNPKTLWSIAQTQRLSGDCRGAILTYKAYVRGASTAGANAATEHIKTCQADLDAQQHAIDAAVIPPKPEPAAPSPEPAKPVPVKADVDPAVRVEPASQPPHDTAPRSWIRDPLGDVLFVVGVGGLATGATFLVLGASHLGGAPDQATSGAYDRAVSDGHSDRTIGFVTGAVGAVAVGLAIWRFASIGTTREDAHVGVVPARGGAFASYTSRF